MVRAESVWLPSCPSQTTTSVAPPARNPSTAALISPVSSWRISLSLGSVWSWRQTPATPPASVIIKTDFFACPQQGARLSRTAMTNFIPEIHGLLCPLLHDSFGALLNLLG